RQALRAASVSASCALGAWSEARLSRNSSACLASGSGSSASTLMRVATASASLLPARARATRRRTTGLGSVSSLRTAGGTSAAAGGGRDGLVGVARRLAQLRDGERAECHQLAHRLVALVGLLGAELRDEGGGLVRVGAEPRARLEELDQGRPFELQARGL